MSSTKFDTFPVLPPVFEIVTVKDWKGAPSLTETELATLAARVVEMTAPCGTRPPWSTYLSNLDRSRLAELDARGERFEAVRADQIRREAPAGGDRRRDRAGDGAERREIELRNRTDARRLPIGSVTFGRYVRHGDSLG